MLACPVCRAPLTRGEHHEGGLGWRCREGHGVALTIPNLRRTVDAQQIQSIWSRSEFCKDLRPCPSCTQNLELSSGHWKGRELFLDICKSCRLFWFDRGELQTLQQVAPGIRPDEARVEAGPESMDPRSVEAIVRMEFALMAERAEDNPHVSQLDRVTSFAGLPTLLENEWLPRRHWLTFGLIASLVLTHVLGLAFTGEPLLALGFLPSEPLRLHGLTWLSAFFVHTGALHLLVNGFFLAEFGGEAEDDLGRRDLMKLLAAATVVGHLVHAATTPDPFIPVVGASGGLSGLIAFYAMRFPHRRMVLHIYWSWRTLPVSVLFVIWVFLQILGFLLGAGAVAYGAHLGGAALGAVVGWVVRRSHFASED